MSRWVYYSSKTGTTASLLRKAGLDGLRLPSAPDTPTPEVHAPFILLTPSFGDAYGKGSVPRAVIHFLNNPLNRQWLRAVVACGDRNFSSHFASAGDVIASKCQVPLLLRIERAGTATDCARLRAIDAHFCTTPHFSPTRMI